MFVVGRQARRSSAETLAVRDLGPFLAGGGVEKEEMVVNVHDQGFAVGRECDTAESVREARLSKLVFLVRYLSPARPNGAFKQRLSGLHVPAAQIEIIAPRNQAPTVREKSERAPSARPAVTRKPIDLPAAIHPEQANRIVVA